MVLWRLFQSSKESRAGDESVRRDPSGTHEKIEDDLFVVFVEAHRLERLGGEAFLLLEVVGQEAGLVADVVGRSQAQVSAELLLVQREDVVTRIGAQAANKTYRVSKLYVF